LLRSSDNPQLRTCRIDKVILAAMLAPRGVESHLRDVLEQSLEVGVSSPTRR
jgi:hypothetical protein